MKSKKEFSLKNAFLSEVTYQTQKVHENVKMKAKKYEKMEMVTS